MTETCVFLQRPSRRWTQTLMDSYHSRSFRFEYSALTSTFQRTHTHTHAHIDTRARTHMHGHARAHTLARTRTRTDTRAHTHARKRAHTHPHARAGTHTHARAHTGTRTRAHTHALTCWFCYTCEDFHRRLLFLYWPNNIFYCPTPTLPLNLALTEDILHFYILR